MKKADNHRTTLVVRCMSAEKVKINLGGMEMKNVNWKELFIDILVDIVAGMIIAVGIYNFALNADFPVAGFSGIAIILYHIFGLPVGAGTIILNVPVAIFCYKFLGKEFFLKSIKSYPNNACILEKPNHKEPYKEYTYK